jgi:glycosyltransferase involved in cell wall biosynthesis
VKLAVVVPAYKDQYLAKSLESLAAQSDGAFRVYIGDDASPHPIKPVVDRFARRLDLCYHRFEENIGAKDLVAQWERCVDLIGDEDWIWLFSDDDLAGPNCVETFRRFQRSGRGEVCRFATAVIDQNDGPLSPSLPSPPFESSEEMAYHLLHWQRGNSMPDHVFSRAVYRRTGGFVHTPFAQGADWATSIRFSQRDGMHFLGDALVRWRLSGANISSQVSRKRAATLAGHYEFIRWVLHHFRYLREEGPRHGITYEAIQSAALYNLKVIIARHYKGLPPSLYPFHVRFLKTHFGLALPRAVRHLTAVVLASRAAR